MSGRALPEANDDGQDAGFVQLLGEEDGSEDENPRLGPENPGGKGRCGYAYRHPRYCHGRTYGVADRTDTIDLQSGHVYQVRLERNEWVARCGATRRSLSDPRLWIEDHTTDQVVAGDRAFKW